VTRLLERWREGGVHGPSPSAAAIEGWGGRDIEVIGGGGEGGGGGDRGSDGTMNDV